MKSIACSAALFAFACSSSSSSPDLSPKPTSETTTTPRAEKKTAPIRDGVYSCEIWSDWRFPCIVETIGAAQTLHKIHGTHRIKGEITATENGFRFVGVFASNYPPRYNEIDVEFTRTGTDAFSGSFETRHLDGQPSDKETVKLVFEADAYGGKSYGAFFTKAELEKEARELAEDEDAYHEQFKN